MNNLKPLENSRPEEGEVSFDLPLLRPVWEKHDGFLPLKEIWAGNVSGNITRTFNNDFQLASVSINGGAATNYTYDTDGLLTAVDGLTLTRNSQNGLLTGATLGSVTDTYSYNSFGEVTGYTAAYPAGLSCQISYTRDSIGRITGKTEAINGINTSWEYIYDTAGRLTRTNLNSGLYAEYGYDTNGNRLTKTTTSQTISGTYDAQDRLMTYGNYTYTYTANGELASKTNMANGDVTSYSYDVLGNLKSVLLPDETSIEYVIDGRNRRVGKKVNGTLERQWIYDGQLRPVAEMDGTGALVSQFVYASHINVPDYIIKGAITYRVITDHLGSLRFVINQSTGAIAQRMDYDDWGNVLVNTAPDFTPFGFAGGMYDSQTKLVRFGARDYDAEVGRWTGKDVFMTCGQDSLNLYVYSNNSPAEWVDPYGLWCIPIGKIAITDWAITETGPFTYQVHVSAIGGIASACWTQYYEWAVMQRTTRKARICYEPDCYCGGVSIFVETYGEYIHETKTVKHVRTAETTRCRRATGFHTGGDIEEGDSYMTYQPFEGDRPVCVTPENK